MHATSPCFLDRTTSTSLLSPVILALALTGCGDSGGDPTGSSTGSSTGSPTGDPSSSSSSSSSSGSTGSPGTDTADASTSTGPTPTTGEPTTGEPTTGEPTTGDTTDATTGGGLADCGFDDSVEWDRTGTIWQLRSEDGQTCVWLERRDDSEPDVIYKVVPYTLLELKAGHQGVVDHMTDQAKMAWMGTHHNWMDVAEAWNDSVRYRLADQYTLEFVDQFDLSAIDEQTDAVLWGPIRLYPYQP